jgi:hypothetical protein
MAKKAEAISPENELDELDANIVEDVNFWVRKQRELVTSQVDFNLYTLKDLADQNAIDLRPHFQRRFRWTEEKKSQLIESFLMNVPVPPIYLNEDEYGKYSIIDGKQRLSTIQEFFSGSFALSGLTVFSDLNGRKMFELPAQLQTILKTRPTVRAIIILRQSDRDIKYEVFQRLNTGGVRLNAQEIRNNAFPGALSNLINSLGEEDGFHRMLGIKNKHKSYLYQQMRDSELVLRYFTFHDQWENFEGGVRGYMDEFMERNRNRSAAELENLEALFKQALEKVDAVFGENSFRRWLPDKEAWRRQFVAALFDAQMFGLQSFTAEQLAAQRAEIIESFKALFSDVNFLKSITVATNTPSAFKDRIHAVREIVQQAI